MSTVIMRAYLFHAANRTFNTILDQRWTTASLRVSLVIALNLGCRPTTVHAAQDISAVWANEGEDKVVQSDLRASSGKTVTNSVWDGTKISIFGGRNEVVAFNVVLEAASRSASNVKVSFSTLTGPAGAVIKSVPATGNGVFNWVGRNIELFYVRYLPIHGMSIVANETYDERVAPVRMRRPYNSITGIGSGSWSSRPDHDKSYPDIAVPLELVPTFSIAAGNNQSIWVDVFIPKTATPGAYLGSLVVTEGGALAASIPVTLQVYNFTLPDTPSAKTMLYYSEANINQRYLGAAYVDPLTAAGSTSALLRDRHYQLAHRHKISLIGDSPSDCGSTADHPCDETVPRLDGSLFSSAHGYDGPGLNTGNNIYSIGTYGTWSWNKGSESDMDQHTNAWTDWFAQHAGSTEYFLYLIDESTNFTQIEQWAQWILNNPGTGKAMRSMATTALPSAAAQSPSLDIPTSTLNVGITNVWEPLDDTYTAPSNPRKKFFMYNGHRPASGSFVTEDDGIALRELAWGQYKKQIDRWFYWESTYYNNNQGGTGQTNVFTQAQTFGGAAQTDTSTNGLGQTSAHYGNDDGVLFYPGTDTVFPGSSYGVQGPFASLRLKYWRRGIQDVDYLTLAAAINPSAVQTIVNTIVPKVLWDYGVADAADPTYVHTELSWSTDPDVWEAARRQLAGIIAGASSGPTTPNPVTLPQPTLNLPSELQTDAEITAGYPPGYSIASFEWSFIPTTPSAAAVAAAVRSSSLANVVVSTYSTNGATAELGALNVSPGYYKISVIAIDTSNNVSPPGQAFVTLVSPGVGSVGAIRVYPNPWRADQNYPRHVTFDQFPANSTVTIFTVSGHEVKELSSAGATSVTWDLTTSSGSDAGSGLYLYVMSTPQGSTTRGKFAIIR